MNDYTYLAKELTGNKQSSNNLDIGTIKSINPMSISLPDITLDQDDIILTDKIAKLITPMIPEIECDNNCKVKDDIYKEDKLNIGDNVLLQSVEDGQKFIVIDRVYL